MADFAQHLPLSQRRGDDESEVTSDRREAVAALLEQAAPLLAGAPEHTRDFLADTGLRLDETDPVAAASAVRAGRRRGVRDLTRTLRALLVLADAVGTPVVVAPPIAGAVGLYAATRAPFDRRAVIRGHAVRAVDQDWGFGRGPVLEGSADTILRFLLALSDIPPQRPDTTSPPPTTVGA